MAKTSAPLTLFGIQIRMDASWILFALLIAWSLASGVFPELYRGLPGGSYWGMAAAAVVGIAISIVLHELGHSLIARAFGIPIRSITLFIFGGVAEMEGEPRSPWAELIMAIAGPLVSVALGVSFLTLGASVSEHASREFVGVLEYLGTLNLMLAVFNMAPAFPLDGGRVLRAIIWMTSGDPLKATRIAARAGEAIGLLLLALGALVALATGLGSGLWWVLIGWFVFSMARAHRRDAEARQNLAGAIAGDFMTPDPVTAPADMTVDEFIETVLARFPHDLIPVVAGGEVIGAVGFKEARAVPRARWQDTSLSEIATPIASIPSVRSSDPIEKALSALQENRASRLLVIDDGRLTGILTLKDLVDHMRFRSEFPEAR
jgi:Zn-dependent protease/CBS domain-containing protein